MYTRVKRILDLALALPLLLLLIAVLPVMWLLGRLEGFDGLFYRQERVGLRGRIIPMIKFRTLEHRGDEVRTNALLNGARRLGIDELPQVLLILRGEMSSVGPRPLLVEDLAGVAGKRSSLHPGPVELRQSVKPGLTGVSQILLKQRDRVGISSWKMLAADLWYVEHCTLGLDLAILVLTLFYTVTGGAIRFPARWMPSRPTKAATLAAGHFGPAAPRRSAASRERVAARRVARDPLDSLDA